MQSGDHQRESTVRFHAVGLSDVSGKGPQGWKMSSLPDIRQLLGHSKVGSFVVCVGVCVCVGGVCVCVCVLVCVCVCRVCAFVLCVCV